MITVAQSVEKIISRSPLICEGMSKNLINLSELARQIQPEICNDLIKDVQTGAIIMALKRLQPKFAKSSIQTQAIDLIHKISDITLRSNLVEFTFQTSPHIIAQEHKLLDWIATSPHKFKTISQGTFETTIIVHEEHAPKVSELFASEKMIENIPNLACIAMKLPPQNVQTPGVYYLILRELMWHNLNIIDTVSTSNEIVLFFLDKHVDDAFIVLKKMINKK